MKAIDKLIQLRKEDPFIVAIAKDRDGLICIFKNKIPVIYNISWANGGMWNIERDDNLEFDSDNWMNCIVTYKDLENYEVKMMSISVQEYERLLDAEKKLKEIQKFFV